MTIRSTIVPVAVVATLFVAGGAMLATAQGVPQPGAGGVQAADGARVTQANWRGDREGRRGGPRGMRGGPLGAFGAGGAAALLDQVDADDDGRLTQDEIDAFLQARVAEADGDGDGSLVLDEFAPLFFEQVRPRMVDAFQRLDADGSGAITGAEIEARFGGLVDRFDRDGDGALSPEDRRRR